MDVKVEEELSQNQSSNEEDETDDEPSDEAVDENAMTEKEEEKRGAKEEQQDEKQTPSLNCKNPRAHKPSLKSVRRDHPEDFIIRNLDEGMQLRQIVRRDVALL